MPPALQVVMHQGKVRPPWSRAVQAVVSRACPRYRMSGLTVPNPETQMVTSSNSQVLPSWL